MIKGPAISGQCASAAADTGFGRRYVGRQGIFDPKQRVWAYELLDRDGAGAPGEDGDAATARVLHHSLHVIGLGELTNRKPAFVNFTRKGLLDEMYTLVSPQGIVVELLEDVEIDAEVLEACRRVKELGYTLALDDLTDTAGVEQVLPIADIVKIDWMLTTRSERWELCRRLRRPGLKLLAEKVETRGEFAEARTLGCTLFQGFFFQKPQTVEGRELPSHALAWVRFLQTVNKPTVDFVELEEVVRSDASVATKLLKRLNAPEVGCSQRITSIRQALVLLGEVSLRKWGAVVAASSLAVDKPTELMLAALIRAHVCEAIGPMIGMQERSIHLFTMGLMSLMDAMTDTPLERLVTEMRVEEDLADALLRDSGPLSALLRLAVALERVDGEGVRSVTGALNLTEEAVQGVYEEAVRWADRVTASMVH